VITCVGPELLARIGTSEGLETRRVTRKGIRKCSVAADRPFPEVVGARSVAGATTTRGTALVRIDRC
jgi:hypothetical protein